MKYAKFKSDDKNEHFIATNNFNTEAVSDMPTYNEDAVIADSFTNNSAEDTVIAGSFTNNSALVESPRMNNDKSKIAKTCSSYRGKMLTNSVMAGAANAIESSEFKHNIRQIGNYVKSEEFQGDIVDPIRDSIIRSLSDPSHQHRVDEYIIKPIWDLYIIPFVDIYVVFLIFYYIMTVITVIYLTRVRN